MLGRTKTYLITGHSPRITELLRSNRIAHTLTAVHAQQATDNTQNRLIDAIRSYPIKIIGMNLKGRDMALYGPPNTLV